MSPFIAEWCHSDNVHKTRVVPQKTSVDNVGQCKTMEVWPERTIMMRSDFIAVHWSTMDFDRCPAMPSLVAVASLSDEGRHRAMSKDVGRCTTMEVWTHHKSPLVLKWRNINGGFRLHCCASVNKLLWMTSISRCWPMHSDEVWTHHNGAFRLHHCAS